MTKRVLVDFDNTLTKDDVEYWNGEREEPDEAVCEATRQCYFAGNTIIVWTARPWREANTIAARLVEWDVPYHGIRCQKGSGDVYVDDKAMSLADYTSAYVESP